MNASCTRFRAEVAANPYIFKYWQFATNRFFPKKRRGYYFFITEKGIFNQIERELSNTRNISCCFNDTPLCSDDDFDIICKKLHNLLETKFPNKSSFEL